MNFLTLRYFKTVASELNITHAANKLYISQQALSSHIRNLEEELGVKLFNRTPRLSLTDAGRCLYEAAQSFDDINATLNDKLNSIRNEERGELRIGLSFTRGQFILPHVLPEYAKSHPQVHINIYEERSNALLERLLRGEIDFWISADNPDVEGLVKEPLFKESFYMVVPLKVLENTFGQKKASALAEKMEKNFEIEDVSSCPFVLLTPGNRSRDLFDNVMRTHKLTPNILLETDNSQTAFELSQKEMALTLYSDMFLRNYTGALNPSVKLIPLEKYVDSDLLHVFYNADNVTSRYKEAFLEDLHRAFVV
ncbi:MAG: LysR family transcriptional regulator [Sphaerochaetaceae bacterium]|nr:LysR family transcriptional regulator [Sphaerochaetaceae bacterium]